MRSTLTKGADLDTPGPYEELSIKYGLCPFRANRPCYIRLLVECKTAGKVVHTVCHLVLNQTNQKGAYAISRDTRRTFNLSKMLKHGPTDKIVFEVADLHAFLFLTLQRKLHSLAGSDNVREFRSYVKDCPVDVEVKLGDPRFSHELVKYIDDTIANTSKVVHTLEQLGHTDGQHAKGVQKMRRTVGLWT